jgi:hypothetical protein
MENYGGVYLREILGVRDAVFEVTFSIFRGAKGCSCGLLPAEALSHLSSWPCSDKLRVGAFRCPNYGRLASRVISRLKFNVFHGF